MPKGNIVHDTFEQLAELGQSTAKGTAKAVAQTFSPAKLWEKATGAGSGTANPLESAEKGKNKPNHTPLDFDKLQSSYKTDDEAKLKILRSRLFQKVKREEQEVIDDKKRAEIEKKQKEQREIEMKKRQELEKQQSMQGGLPKGKERKSIMSPKRKAQEKTPEMKPATGKS